MSKVVIAVNAMIEQRDKIKQVTPGNVDTEIFFMFDNKHKWSMIKGDDSYSLIYYPGSATISVLANLEVDEWGEVPMISYRSKEIGTREAKESFKELYDVIKELVYGMDDVFDDIIGSHVPL